MKKLFVITVLILGTLALVFILFAGYYFFRLMNLGEYPSGGVLSAGQAGYDVTFYDIELCVNPEDQTIQGKTWISFRLLDDTLSTLELDLLESLNILSVTDEHQSPLIVDRKGHKVYIRLPQKESASIRKVGIEYQGKPLKAFYPPWKGGFNWSKDASGKPWIGLSCQGEGAKVWMPCKDHPSDKPDSVSLHIAVPRDLFCASNGVLDSVTEKENGYAVYHWFTRYPISNYNISLNIGLYQIRTRTYITLTGDTMPVMYYVLPEHLDKADSLIDMAVDMLYTYRKYYGEYPFTSEKFGLADNDYLGMEHQTINAYGNRYRFEMLNGHRFDKLMLHEMGHEWWGNKVTARDWSDFWIHEGFCTYGEGLYHREKTGEKGYHAYMAQLRSSIQNKQPIASRQPMNTSQAYHSDIYNKGAYILHSLRFMLGDSLFFSFLRTLTADPMFTYHHLTDTESIIRLLNRLSGHDYRSFIEMHLYTTDVPEIQITPLNSGHYQIRATNIPYSIPMDIVVSHETRRYLISSDPITVTSSDLPVIDPQEWFLKKVFTTEP